MKFLFAGLAIAAFSLSACAPDTPEPAEPETDISATSDAETDGEITLVDCLTQTFTYPLNYQGDTAELTEGTSAALEEEFQELLPIAASCGGATITLRQPVSGEGPHLIAEARKEAFMMLMNEEYDVPLYFLDSEMDESITLPDMAGAEIFVSFEGE
ncbi:MAG: hypothetical protein CMK09_15430 [Ponticaulis sp.]|nr:hypothetical protein [Ponticaulis sp.]|tara:strand:+ start:11287 stop:11757 length:471 start_codon:yes stop_codon:yes gene_type:complete